MITLGHELFKKLNVGKLGGGDQIIAAQYIKELEGEASRFYHAFIISFTQFVVASYQHQGQSLEDAQRNAKEYILNNNPIERLNNGTLGPAYDSLKAPKSGR